MSENKQRNKRQSLEGIVVSDKMQKSITVLWERQVMHPMTHKYVKRRKKLHAHDENNDAHEGDLVEITATRPMSKLKSWRLVRVLRRAHAGLRDETATPEAAEAKK